MDEPVVLALDVGGTTIKGCLVERDGTVIAERTDATPREAGQRAVVDAVRGCARALAAGRAVRAAGVVVPGVVDVPAGVARYAANLGWRDVPLRDPLAADLGVPVALGHDVRAAGLAEARTGRARGVEDALVVVIGTGIAAVLVSNGHPVAGANGAAGELGHLPVYPDGERCTCGQRGCVEAYASGAAIARRFATRGGSGTAEDVAAALGRDRRAAQVWQEAADALGRGLAMATGLLDPGLIVLGGGLSEAGELLLAPVRAALAAQLTWRAAPPIAASALGARAGRLGAALLAWQEAP